jgi:hypothetical protein
VGGISSSTFFQPISSLRSFRGSYFTIDITPLRVYIRFGIQRCNSWRSAAQNFLARSVKRRFLVKQCTANSGMFRIAHDPYISKSLMAKKYPPICDHGI